MCWSSVVSWFSQSNLKPFCILRLKMSLNKRFFKLSIKVLKPWGKTVWSHQKHVSTLIETSWKPFSFFSLSIYDSTLILFVINLLFLSPNSRSRQEHKKLLEFNLKHIREISDPAWTRRLTNFLSYPLYEKVFVQNKLTFNLDMKDNKINKVLIVTIISFLRSW